MPGTIGGQVISFLIFFLYILFPYKRFVHIFVFSTLSIDFSSFGSRVEWRMRRFDRSFENARERSISIRWKNRFESEKREWKHATPFVIRSDDYRLSRLLHARTNVWLPMDNVVRRLQTVRGKNYPTYIFKITKWKWSYVVFPCASGASSIIFEIRQGDGKNARIHKQHEKTYLSRRSSPSLEGNIVYLASSLSLDLIINLLFINYILTSLQDYCSRLGFKTANWTLDDAFEYISNKANRYETPSNASKREENSVKIYDKYSPRIAEKLNELKDNPNVDDERANDINNSGKLMDSKGVKD